MSQKKPTTTGKRLVWRISERFPLGAFVDPDEDIHRLSPRRDPVDPGQSSGWMVSSFELAHGADVIEDQDTVPADLFDELFPGTPASPPEAA